MCPGFPAPNASQKDYAEILDYMMTALPPESPPAFGLHPNAEIGYLTNTSEALFKTIVDTSGGGGGGGDEEGGDGGEDIVRSTLNMILETLPEEFVLFLLQRMAKPLLEQEAGPFVVVALQEAKRMNALLAEMKRSLIELDKGLKGQLNMSQSMEDLVTALRINEVPGRNPFALCKWEARAWPSLKGLASWYVELGQRQEQLVAWTEELTLPITIWLPGLFNPTAYLTAVMQVTARRREMPLDRMTTETHVSTYQRPDEPQEYAQDGAYCHGLFLEGARWPTGDDAGEPYNVTGTPCAGCLMDGRLKELLPPMPVVYVKAVAVQDDWEASAVGYLRNVDDIYECPIYLNQFRGPTYITLATLKTEEPKSKWVLSGTAIVMQQNM